MRTEDIGEDTVYELDQFTEFIHYHSAVDHFGKGQVDYGGGGTIAQYMANRNIDTLDAGVPVLSMHAPFETVSKLDCYMTYKAMKALYEEM